jgi:DNA-binding CsgD family transcriptional regulator
MTPQEAVRLTETLLTGLGHDAGEDRTAARVDPIDADQGSLTESGTRSASFPQPAFDLTRREREILALLCQRLTDQEIAESLFISPYTASKHVSNILGKLGVANRRQAAAFAARHGLG